MALNMDTSSVQQFSHSDKSLISDQAVPELNFEAGIKGSCDRELEVNDMNSEGIKHLDKLPVCELLESRPDDPIVDSRKESPDEGLSQNCSLPKEAISELNHVCGSIEVLEKNQSVGFEKGQSGPLEMQQTLSDRVDVQQVQLYPEKAEKDFPVTRSSSSLDDLTIKPIPELNTSPGKESGPPPDDPSEVPGLDQVKPTLDADANKSGLMVRGRKGRAKKQKNVSKSLVGNTRVLRSRSEEKPKQPVNVSVEDAGSRENKRKRKKKKNRTSVNDEFSKIRTHLRYLINRMKFQQLSVDVCSGEGWKGQSSDKIQLLTELQRAKSEILRCKSRIRDIFQRIDASSAEGRIPESLFDSEDEIDSEDIFCAKCKSADVELDNDILLCDGACQRGFHQFCLEPPLLKEQVPPGDEGWLCPACDCKVDCIDMLNDSLGTNLSISDSWEKVFPEAASAGNKLNDDLELPSDDSEDDDYNPDRPESEEVKEGESEEVKEGDDSSSDESDFSSASEDLDAYAENKQHSMLPSDESEDDDYDPDKVVPDEHVNEESSSSDFTSDSEDLDALIKDAEPLAEVQGPPNSDQIKSNGGSAETFMAKRLLAGELSGLLESDPGDGVATPISVKRHVERLDYKKLYDEEYGCVPSSDSSDEDFMDAAAPKRRKDNAGKSLPSTRKYPKLKAGTVTGNMDTDDPEQSKSSLKKRASKKLDAVGTSSSAAKSDKGSSEVGSRSRGSNRQKKLGEAVTQRLYESFKQNQYPDRGRKNDLAKELEISVEQVNKWFQNARWSVRHSDKGIQVEKVVPGSGSTMAAENMSCNAVETNEQSHATPGKKSTKKGYTASPRTPISGKQEVSDQQAFTSLSVGDTTEKTAEPDVPEAQGVRRSGRLKSKSSEN